jgi:NADH dehydrogenase FAD-containing subunit
MREMKEKRKIVIIGGVAGGMSFANRYRRLNINDEIIVFEKGPYVSFANCGLPYFMSGEINSRSRLLVAREEDLIKKFNLIIRSNSEVTLRMDTLLKRVMINSSYRLELSLFSQILMELIQFLILF